MSDKIKRLMEEVRELEASPENQRRKNMYRWGNRIARDQWRGMPKNDHSIKYGNLPVQIDMPAPYWHKCLRIDYKKHFVSGEQFVEDMLRIKIERFKQIPDDIFVDKDINMFMGVPFGASFFGHQILFMQDTDPEVRYRQLFTNEEELKQLGMVDFYRDGLMPLAIRLYEEALEAVDPDFHVQFPQWIRAPFGICAYARGYQELLMDFLLDPDFAEEEMRYFTDCRIHWHEEMCRYLGERVDTLDLFNDDVNIPNLSPQLYEEFVLPCEIRLSETIGSVQYWHSCGNTAALAPVIAKIPNLYMYNNGPWTDPRPVAEVFGGTDTVIELQVNPQSVVVEGDERQIHDYLSDAVRAWLDFDVSGATIRANNVVPQRYEGFALERVKEFIRIARQVIEEQCR